MPPRVVTADLETLLGVPVLAAVCVPYRADAAVPPPLGGGCFVDLLVRLPPGTVDAASLNSHCYEALDNAPGQLKRLNDGALHEIWGWPKRLVELDPLDEDDIVTILSERRQCILYDLGARLNWRMRDARPIPRGDGRVVVEALVDSPGNSGNRPLDYLYDSLDAHPPGLREAIERSPWARRETIDDPAPGWGDTKPGPV